MDAFYFFLAFPRSRDMEVKRYKGGKVFRIRCFTGWTLSDHFLLASFFFFRLKKKKN